MQVVAEVHPHLGWRTRKRVQACTLLRQLRHLSSSLIASTSVGVGGRGGGGLTCLSVGCLSSYLIFPPVPVTRSQGAKLAQETRTRAPVDLCAISHLTSDRVTANCAEGLSEPETDCIGGTRERRSPLVGSFRGTRSHASRRIGVGGGWMRSSRVGPPLASDGRSDFRCS
jgi:hypothetical protein